MSQGWSQGGARGGNCPPLTPPEKSPRLFHLGSFFKCFAQHRKKIQKDKMSCYRKTILTYKNKKRKSCIDHPLTIVLLIFSFKLLYCPNLQLITIYDTLLFNSIFFCYPSYFLLLFLGFFFHHNDGGLKFYTLFYYYFYIEKINYLMSQYGIEILKPPLSIFSPS